MANSRFKRWFKIPNLLNGLFFTGLVVLAFNPSAKAMVIQGLIHIGFFQPKASELVKTEHATAVSDIVFEATDGQLIHLANQKGKVVFINFWTTWCPPCIAEMPSINGLYEKLKNNKNIIFIIADADRNFQKSRPFMAKHHLTMPLYKPVSNVPKNFLSNSIPTTTIIDRNGNVVFHHEGSADYSNPKMLQYLNNLSK